MHPNPAFRSEAESRNLGFARERGFGTLAVPDAGGAPLLSHIPFLLDETGETADLHLVRSNPILRAVAADGTLARIAVTGPDSYISPDWYGVADQVPTWNYVAVHLTGRLHRLPQDRLRDLIDRQSAHFEDRLMPKTPWTTTKMDGEVLERMMRMIVPFQFSVDQVDGTWKLNQNKPDAARNRAADSVDAFGLGQETALMAALMRGASE